MPSWNEVLQEVQGLQRADALDVVRRKYLKKLHEYTGRNVIAYYSGWLQKPDPRLEGTRINDDDKNGLMTTIHQLDRTKGLDLLLHTPGGNVAATESLVNYLHVMFEGNIRAIIPQIAMSGGTMIACACKEIIMGKQSNLGPIDPQFGGIPAEGVKEEFARAKEETKKDPATIPLWQVIIGRYHPTFIGECENAIDWSKEVVTSWLEKVMFAGQQDAQSRAGEVVKKLSARKELKSHDRHIHRDDCKQTGLKIIDLENNNDFQDLVLTIHHAYMHTFSQTPAFKIIENHNGVAMIHLADIRPAVVRNL